MRARLEQLETSARMLGVAKLANVGLSMLWGFAVTFVFVRVLPTGDFRAFLLLAAVNNLTLSAEFGLTNIIYARLRRFWLALRGAGEESDFRVEEIGVLFVFLTSVIGAATLAVLVAIATGTIRTGVPLLFLLFFLGSALNLLLLLARRALGAVECNLLWEGLDLLRRLASLGALLAVLAGFELLASVALQLVFALVTLVIAAGLLHRRLHMRLGQWFALRVGGGHVRRVYWGQVGASVLLTLSEVGGYNAPYFVIGAMSHDMRLLLLFDFLFKLSRAVSTAIRATIEAVLPPLTRAWYAGDGPEFAARMRMALLVALGVAGSAALLLMPLGPSLFRALFHGQATIGLIETLLIAGVLMALALVCVSVYVQGALGRFAPLLRLSLPFLIGSPLAVPLALAWSGDAGMRFLLIYALLFAILALLHWRSIRRLTP